MLVCSALAFVLPREAAARSEARDAAKFLLLSRALKSRQMEFSNPAISRSNKSSANPNPQVFARQIEMAEALCRWCYSSPIAGETEAGSRETAHSRLGNRAEEEGGKVSSLPST